MRPVITYEKVNTQAPCNRKRKYTPNPRKRIERKICEPTEENGTWRSKINHDLYKLNKEPQIARLII